jgi:GAF domain-containing protein/anti-sigma regulatory factor (Ser/Thr protein kinase)
VTPVRRSGSYPYGPIARSAFARYGLATVLALAALVIGRILLPLVDAPPYSLLVGAVAVAIWYGGFGPGLLAVVIGWSLSPALLTRADGFGFERYDDYRWTISLVVALVVVWVSLVMRRGQQRAATAAVAAEESTRQMETLQQLATALSAAVTPSDVAHELVQRTPALLGARGGALGLIEGEDLVIVDPAGVDAQTHRPGLRLPLATRAPITRAAAEGTVQRADDRQSFESRFPDGAALTSYAQAALAVPLRAAGEVVGSMSFLFDRPEAANDEADSIALIAADLGGQALERARLYERERQSRRALDRILRAAPRLYAGSSEAVSVAICREARRTLEADLTEIWKVDADWLWLELVCRDPEDERLSADDRLEIARLPGLLQAVENLEVRFVGDAEEHLGEELLAYVRRLGIRSWLWAPIVVGGHAERILFFAWQKVMSEPDASTMVLARRFSDHAGLALEQLERRQAQEEAARRALETRRLLETTAALAATATPTEVTAAILQEGQRSLGAVRGVVVCRTEEHGEFEVVDSHGIGPESLEAWRRIPLEADMPLAEAARDHRLLTIEDAEELERRYPRFRETIEEQDGAWLVLPLAAAGSVIGVAAFSFPAPRTFDEAELEFAEALARQSGQALERALLLAAEYAARTRAEDMVVLASALSQAVAPADVVHAVGVQVVSLVGADVAGVYLLDDGTNLDLVETVGRPLGDDARLRRIPIAANSPLAEAGRLREAVWLGAEDEWSSFAETEPWRVANVRSMGAVPLVLDQRLLGVLFVGFATETVVDEEARLLVESLTRQAAQPLERAWLMEREQSARVAAETASRRTRRLQSTTQALAAAPAPRDVAAIVVSEAIAAVSADAGALFAFEPEREAPEVLAEVGLGDDALAKELTGPVIDAALSGSLLVIDGDSPPGMHVNAVREAIGRAGLRSAACVPLAVGGRILGSLVLCFRTRDRLPEEDVALLQTLARIGSQALERSRLFDEEHRLRERSERLQDMTAALSGSLTQSDVARVVIDAVVRGTGADAAAFSIVLEDRQVTKALAWHGYEEDLVLSRGELPLGASSPEIRALRRRTTTFYETAADLEGEYTGLSDAIRLTGHQSFLVVPLVAGRKANGLILVSWQEPVVLTDEDRVFIETLAGQAAQALDRARHFELERTIAETLQRSVLPGSLPRIENVQLAARYLPGTEEVDVGGDWFDAILLANGRIGLAVGDVVGKGVQSAATMAQLRNALRAFALDQMKPSSTVSRLNRLIDGVSDSAFATVVYAVVDPDAGVCRFTAAGHPPPLLLRTDGRAEYLEGGRGLPLGTGPDTKYRQQVVELPVGSTLILYTDGLIERRDEPIDSGLDQLRQAVEEGPGDPERLLEYILDRLVGPRERGDDIAVLAVRLLAVPPQPLDLRLPSGPRSLDLVRDAIRVWLQHAPATQSEVHEIVLATWEACANAIEHPDGAANGSFQVLAELENSAVRVSVRDSGRWLPETERPNRGLGLRLIRSVMSSVDIDVTDEGTLVRLEKDLAGDQTSSLRRAR